MKEAEKEIVTYEERQTKLKLLLREFAEALKNTTQYSIFPPRYVGFKILLVLSDSDISEREYKAMTDSGRWKKANQDFIMKK